MFGQLKVAAHQLHQLSHIFAVSVAMAVYFPVQHIEDEVRRNTVADIFHAQRVNHMLAAHSEQVALLLIIKIDKDGQY